MEKYLDNYPLTHLKKLSASLQKTLTFVDLETTGLVHEKQFAIIEIGIVHIDKNDVKEVSALVDPKMRIPQYITEITGITNDMVRGKRGFEFFVNYFEKIAKEDILCGFNSRPFDSKGIERMGKKYDHSFVFNNQIDIRQVFIKTRNNLLGTKSQAGKLTEASAFHNVSLKGTAHRAAYDIALTVLLAEQLLKENGFNCLSHEFLKIDCPKTKRLFENLIIKNKK